MIENQLVKEELDAEWVLLIMEAKKLGMKVQEVRSFIQDEKDYLVQSNTK